MELSSLSKIPDFASRRHFYGGESGIRYIETTLDIRSPLHKKIHRVGSIKTLSPRSPRHV